ncbi:MAG: hypothetical protein ACLQBA_14580 [Candidatus Binataceae bacterium]
MEQLAGLQEDARKLALERFRQIQPHLEEHQSSVAIPWSHFGHERCLVCSTGRVVEAKWAQIF